MLPAVHSWALALLVLFSACNAQQQCYFGPGADGRAPSEVVPCLGSGQSACCLLGDTCLSGNTCYNYATGDLYQYGCTDITYTDSTCPYKCGWNTTLSPWTALELCLDVPGVTDTYICHSPESCGCEWNATYDLLVLQVRGCKEMGDDARIALYAPTTLAPYVSLPSTIGGSTGYYSPTTVNGTSTWVSTAVAGYTPATVTELTTYEDGPSSIVRINAKATPSASTNQAAHSMSATATAPANTASTTSASVSSTSSATSVSSTSSASAAASTAALSSNELSPGVKAGIGVGVVGGVCLLAAVGLAAFLWGKRQRQRKAHQDVQPAQGPQSPPMQQGTPHYPSPGDKPPGWQPGYPMGPPFQQSLYYDPNQQSPYMHDGQPQHWAAMPSPPPDERLQKQVSLSPPLAPTELPAERRVHEIDSFAAVAPPASVSPSPEYAEVERARGAAG
ncbi:hypothetical protein LTR08_007606 [Meristemomyces frigidus]|nr:hypothetical protein LTR08_007606 [Meristemomyces frigidus]